MKNLQNIKAKLVFDYFKEISSIPRGSGNEKQISDYLKGFAEKLNLEVIQDDALNIIIKKPASKGYENAPTVIIQGHMDMVCEKNNNKVHDFTKDGLELIVKDDYIYANETTLGADDGIAVAYAMAILADDSIKHPNLEILLTTDEETGMTGAMAVSKDNIKGKILLNIDTEDEGYLLVSCAGGIRTKSIIKLEKEPLKSNVSLFEISIKGLKGGHSGCDIEKERGNANKILGRVLKGISENLSFDLIEIGGGSKNNAIPRESHAIIATNEVCKLKESILIFDEIMKNELKVSDSLVSVNVNEYNKEPKLKISDKRKKDIINLLFLYPNGINSMSTNIDNLVESSTNLGIIKMTDDYIEFDSAVRSSTRSRLDDIVSKIELLTNLCNAQFEKNDPYPAWEYKQESKVREICKSVYKEMYGEDIKVYAIHAGVECGLFEERIGDLDMVSFGPDIIDAHTPNEHLSISSTERVYEYLLKVLENIK
ncbi:aminoacyl-histidine dipeptidase [Clostridium sp. HCP1S3_B4]|uniref:aminoacyl-histidine dipeptidase n=1 Tax=unclassified Clostridium TaxID=2614128 RepID=UPI002A7D2B0B|nr:aminoacyl-histidine dipeptidase [Clostridiales bacterium]MDY2730020.1 aminoacyl-histidine dipeptidase [Clostridium sp.]